jgi:hypothetical protein
MHLGFDRSAYPGDAVMASLWDNTPLEFVGIYLAPAPSHGGAAWMSKVPMLREMGWGFLPVYVGQQAPGGAGSHVLTPEQGVQDAHQAAALAASAGFPCGSVVYLDIELGGLLSNAFLGYIGAWVEEMNASPDFWAGVYCSFKDTAAQIAAHVGEIPTWVFRVRDGGPSTIRLVKEEPPNPTDSGFPAAVAWQYRLSLTGAIDLTWTDGDGTKRTLHQVDLDSSLLPDPSVRLEDVTAREFM